DERIQGILADAVDGEFHDLPYSLNNYWRGYWLPHPVQTNLYGLPHDLIERIVADVEARDAEPERAPGNYEAWLLAAYGRTFTQEFPELYTRKYHTTPSQNLTTDWIGPRMYRPTLEEVVRGASSSAAPNVHYITGFRYPSGGGFGRYTEK